ncbi:unnamed protein product [Sphagnum troendelagicum]|uniref:Tricalbin n=1 Tax=Sphagnum troendelagicum TaxID=128251 RepID=A0ABP0TK15_9BRYO
MAFSCSTIPTLSNIQNCLQITPCKWDFYGLKLNLYHMTQQVFSLPKFHFGIPHRWLLSVQMVEESKKEPSQERQGILNHSLRRVASWISKKDDFQQRLLEQGLSFTQGYRKSNSHEFLVDKDKVPNPMATPPFPSVGDGLVGFGCLVFLAVAVVGWWRKLQSGSKASGTSQANPQASEELQSAQAAMAAPVALSLLLQRDLKKKESAEWLNMVLGKIWNLYRRTLEGWLVELLQPLIDEIPEKPPLVQRVKITQFFLGDDPVTVRSIERRTSRRANDLQYHVGLRYSGNSRIAVSVALKLGFLPLTIPFGIRGLDLDGEMWVKLRLIPTEPWVGTATWAFISLPKVTLAVAPFGILNLMAVPVLNIFLTKLLTRDLPLLFVRPNKSVVNFLQGKAVGPLSKDFKDAIVLNGFAGELSVTLIEAQDLAYFPLGKTDPYVVLLLGEQVIRSKKNSRTSILGPPGAPVWNQDLKLLVVDPKVQRLKLRVRDTIGFTTITVGSIEVPLDDLQDTVPVDKVLSLQSGLVPFPKRFSGKLLLRLTYKAYVEDEEEIGVGDSPVTNKLWDEIGNFISSEMREREPSSMEQSPRVKTISVDAESSDKGFRLTNPLITQTLSGSNGNGRVNSEKENLSDPTVKGPTLVENPALQEQQKKEASSRLLIQSVAKSDGYSYAGSTIMWLAVVAGLSLVVALDLNVANLFNP